ncbi:MAG: DUF3352 domain-containing protein [Chloracidobacterium sp.]|nr:DUF3352 domain-containing protein [Chloracidobacterium sp.]
MFDRTLKVDDDFFYQEGAKGRRAARREVSERRNFRFPRKRWIFAALIILSLMVAGWIYARRIKPVDMASYAPETALGYVEINNWPKLIDNLTSTTAWREFAPAYGVPEGLDYINKAGSLPFGSFGPLGDMIARMTGRGEAAILARSQFALVITGLEVRGERVKPRIALIAETHGGASSAREIAERRLPQFAERAFGRVVRESGDYAGVPFQIWSASDSEKRLLVAQIDGELIIANDPEPLRECIDTRLGRAPSMVNNFYLRNSRPLVEPSGGQSAIFGFVTGEGVTRLLRFWAFLVSGDMLSKAAVAGAMGDIFTDFSSRAADGIAYGVSFENGLVVDRYTLLFKPDLADALKVAVKPAGESASNSSARRVPRIMDMIPEGARDVTLIGVENPIKALDGIEAAISSRVGAAQSFLLRQFIIGALDFFLGIKENEKADGVIGDEIANFNMTGEAKDRVWLISQRDKAFVKTLIERVFTVRDAKLLREQYKGSVIFSSSDARHGAAVIIDDFLALGERDRLIQLIDAHQSGRNFTNSPQLTASDKTPGLAAIKSFTSVKEETGEMLSAIARWTGRPPASSSALDQLNLATSATTINDSGVYVESHSPFGNFPFFISLADSLMKSGVERK